MSTIDALWAHCVEAIRYHESIKQRFLYDREHEWTRQEEWDKELAQNKVDALRTVMLVFRKDEEFMATHDEQERYWAMWGATSSRSNDPTLMHCPRDGAVMRFQHASMRESVWECTADGETWTSDRR